VVEKGKKEAHHRTLDKLEQTLDRRKTKDELKSKVLNEKSVTHMMLKEIHSLRASNVQMNLQKNKEKRKEYQEELALKLELQKLQMAAEVQHRKTAYARGFLKH
jgi:hypothetical protein